MKKLKTYFLFLHGQLAHKTIAAAKIVINTFDQTAWDAHTKMIISMAKINLQKQKPAGSQQTSAFCGFFVVFLGIFTSFL